MQTEASYPTPIGIALQWWQNLLQRCIKAIYLVIGLRVKRGCLGLLDAQQLTHAIEDSRLELCALVAMQ